MKFKAVLFDLDGTLSESGPGITKSAQYALHKMGIEEPDASKLDFFVGPPLNLTFRERYGMNDEQTLEAIRFFRERYESVGIYETNLYPGTDVMLKKLSESGQILAIASSKPEPLVKKVLHDLSIEPYFAIMVGSNPDAELDNKAGADNKTIIVRETLCALHSYADDIDNSSIAMVGDRFYDIDGAKANHVTAVGVSYGYGSREELEKAGADFIADSVMGLEKILLA